VVACALGALGPAASATVVSTSQVKINGGKGDFGSGNHKAGWPQDNATVEWDYTPNANGVLICRATVNGVLYLDNFEGGTVKLKVTYSSNQAGAAPLAERVHTLSAGFALLGAQDPNHKLFILPACGSVDHCATEPPVSSSTLSKVTFTLLDQNDNPLDTPTSVTSFSPKSQQNFTSVTIDNTPPKFQNGSVTFQRSNGDMQGTVQGKLLWNSTSSNGTARMFVEFQDVNGVVLEKSLLKDSAVTSTPTQNNVNIVSTQALVKGRLFKIRVVVGTAGTFQGHPVTLNPKEQNFDFLGGFNTGTFELTPSDPDVEVGEHFTYAFTWTVPDPLNWHDLQALRLRILDGSDVVLSAYFDEATQTFALLDEKTGKLSQAYPAGSNQSLQTPYATLFMKNSGLQASGPTSPSVTLLLSLSCKPKLGGKWLAVEVAANDDQGNEGAFEYAGGITVF